MSAHRYAEQLATLESLLAIPATDLKLALVHATDLVAAVLRCDKVDAFLYDPARDTLVAVGSSTQPLSALQKKHGLDVLPVTNRGRTVEVYVDGKTFLNGRVDEDQDELPGVREALRIRSQIGVPLDVAGKRRGVLLAASLQPDQWDADDARLAESVARWVGMVVHQAELVEQLERNAADAGRRGAAEDLVTVLAHDLRNFIHPADLAMQLVVRRAERDGRADDVREASKARRGLARLNALVGDILDVARIERGVLTVDVRLTALVPLIEEVAALLTTADQPVVVVAREDVFAVVDAARIRQCVENLVVNAVKHSPRSVPVNITISRSATNDGAIACIEVADQGPGVAPDVLPFIFERFVTGPQTRAGLGLGLFLARQIALLHRGDLVVVSEPAKGARFTLTLPSVEA